MRVDVKVKSGKIGESRGWDRPNCHCVKENTGDGKAQCVPRREGERTSFLPRVSPIMALPLKASGKLAAKGLHSSLVGIEVPGKGRDGGNKGGREGKVWGVLCGSSGRLWRNLFSCLFYSVFSLFLFRIWWSIVTGQGIMSSSRVLCYIYTAIFVWSKINRCFILCLSA